MKSLSILIMLLLLSIGTNVFGYTWTVVNNSGENLNVQLCTVSYGCQNATITPGKSYDFIYTFDSQIGGPPEFNFVTINGQTFNFPLLGVTENILMGGKFSIRGKNSATGYYSFSDK